MSQPRTGASPTPLRETLTGLIAAYARKPEPTTIAIVGNAPMPPDQRRASRIDSSDLVVRMTSFALDQPGRLPSIGTRCDIAMIHRWIIPSPFTFADYTSRLYLLLEQGRSHGEGQPLPPWWPEDLGIVPLSNHGFTRPLNDLLGLDNSERAWATAGTLTSYLMTELFPQATTILTGVSLIDDPGQTTFQHHWGQAVPVTPEHRLHAESRLLQQWHAQGRILVLP